MTVAFLFGFSQQVVYRLVRSGALEVRPGTEDLVALYLANFLGSRGQGYSLVSSVSAGLLACPEVEELFADDDAVKAAVDDMGAGGRASLSSRG